MASEDSGEKSEEPSQHRIDDARKKGDVAASKELNSVLILTGAFSVLIMSSLYMFEVLSEYIEWLYGLEVTKAYSEELGARVFKETFYVVGKCILPVFGTSFVLGFLAQVMQVGILYAPEALALKFDRINPQNGLKRIISKKAVAEVVKGLFKFSVVLVVTYFVLSENITTFTGFLHTEAAEAFTYGKVFACTKAIRAGSW